MSHEIPSISSCVALGCVELFFNQVTTGGGDPVTLQAKETMVIFALRILPRFADEVKGLALFNTPLYVSQ